MDGIETRTIPGRKADDPSGCPAGTPSISRFNVPRRLYDWIMKWGGTRYAAPMLFLWSFVDSSFFPLPPYALLVAMALPARKRAFKYALIGSIGSVFGGMLGYLIGYALFAPIAKPIIAFFHLQAEAGEAIALYNANDVWVIGIGAFTVVPYKVFTILGGFAHLDFLRFVLASTFGRSFRFFLVAALVYFFGSGIKTFIEKYFNVCCAAATALIVLFILLLSRHDPFVIATPPAEIEALITQLESPDLSVRTEADKALSLKTHLFFEYRPDASQEERAAAVQRWRDWFAEWRKNNRS